MDAHEIAYYAVRGTNEPEDVETVEKMIEKLIEQRLEPRPVNALVSSTEWINVGEKTPKQNEIIIGYDEDSMTHEKELLFKDGKFLYCAHGVEIDYTANISRWKPKQ